MSELSTPTDLRYTEEHEWVKDQGEGVVRIGITDYAQQALGDVVFVTVPAIGETVSAGDPCGEVESTKSVSDLFSPLTGEVTAVNEALEATPELVNSDPYGQGWIFEMQVSDEGDLAKLLDVTAYNELTA